VGAHVRSLAFASVLLLVGQNVPATTYTYTQLLCLKTHKKTADVMEEEDDDDGGAGGGDAVAAAVATTKQQQQQHKGQKRKHP
jgi:hypothetical protein